MNRYDWGWNRPRGWGNAPRMGRGYGQDFGRWGAGWGMIPGGGWGQGAAFDRYGQDLWEREGYQIGYDRGVYGGSYPAYGGRPGGQERGMYYGGGYDRPYPPRGGRPFTGYDQGGGYDQSFAREPFIPEAAYREHPELDRPQRHRGDRWPGGGHQDLGETLGDDEIRRAVRQNLYNDNWIDAEQIQVEVTDQVVTLKGEVDDYLEARYAWDDAWEATGVRGVINQLTVRTDRPQEAHGDVVPQTSGGKKK